MKQELKILVIRFSSIGDIVLTSPVLRLLNSSKKYDIHFLTKNKYYSLVSENPNIHKIHLLKESLKNIFFDLKKENFDLIIDLHNNIRSNILTFLLSKKTFKLKKIFFRKNNKLHIVDRYLLSLKKLNIVNDNLGLDFYLSKESEIVAARLRSASIKTISWFSRESCSASEVPTTPAPAIMICTLVCQAG